MSRENYDLRNEYTGNGSASSYDFDFKIEAKSQLLVIELDDNDVETQRVRGTDVTYLSSVTFDAVNGGGTVNLASNLTNEYKLRIIQANDAPTQPNQFRNKGSFTLDLFEKALDRLAGAVQRAHYLAYRSLRLSEHVDDPSTFDGEIPAALIGQGNKTIMTNGDGDGLAVGPSAGEVESAETYATEASDSADAAAASESAVAAIAESLAYGSPHTATEGTTNALTGETWLSADYSSVEIGFEVIRGSTVHANGTFYAQKKDGTWRIQQFPYAGDNHQITWSLTGTTTKQLNANPTAGAGDATIKLYKRFIDA